MWVTHRAAVSDILFMIVIVRLEQMLDCRPLALVAPGGRDVFTYALGAPPVPRVRQGNRARCAFRLTVLYKCVKV